LLIDIKFLSNQVFSSLAIYLLFTPLAIATPTTKQLIKTSSRSILLSQNLRNFCQQNESLFVLAETKDFWVNICGGDKPHTYIGISKKMVREFVLNSLIMILKVIILKPSMETSIIV
jgi:hypothetical protein